MKKHVVKSPSFLSFSNGIVCVAYNGESWADPMVQLKDRVLNSSTGAQLLDEDYRVLAAMTYLEAYQLNQSKL